MIISNHLKLQGANNFAAKKIEIGAEFLTMSNRETGGRFAPTAIRMRAIRRASHVPTRYLFAEFLGITVSRLSNVENGFPIGRDLQDKLISRFPWISRGYLMDGDQASLTGATLQRLLPFVAEESDTTLPRSRSRTKSGR